MSPGTLRSFLLFGGASVALAACEPPPPEWMRASVPEPVVFAPGVLSGPMRDYDITFTPDGTEAYFTRRSRRGAPQIYRSDFVEGRWADPVPVAFGSERDEAPFVSADGSRLIFSSRRPHPGQFQPSDNLWEVRREGEGWGAPRPIEGPVNRPREEVGRYTLGGELGPALFPDGGLLYWTRVDPEWGGDLYVAFPDDDGRYGDPEPLRVNSYGDEMNPVVAPGGDYIVFQAYREAEAFGEQDLYVIERTEYGWGEPRLLPEPINSTRNDGWPAFSPDGRHFFFASDREDRGGFYDIFWVDAAALGLGGASSPPAGAAGG